MIDDAKVMQVIVQMMAYVNIFMTRAMQEYLQLIKKTNIRDKYRIKALQIVAETNEQHTKEILEAIEKAIEEAKEQDRAVLQSLYTAIIANSRTKIHTEGTSTKKRKNSEERQDSKVQKIEQKIEQKTEQKERSIEETVYTEIEQTETEGKQADMVYPVPIEYYLLRMIDKQAYMESYMYYTQNDKKQKIEEEKPELTREYLIVLRTELARSVLYTSLVQCKVCGMRFRSTEIYKAHSEQHERRAQIGKAVSGSMYRPWMAETEQWQEIEHKTQRMQLHTSHIQDESEEVPVNGEREQKCTICKEAFEIVWSDEEETWVFRDALVVRASPARQICHKKCAT